MKILMAVLAVLAVVFALQNMSPVSVTFIIWQFQSPLAFVLLGAVGAGLVIAALAFVPTVMRRGFAISASKRRISDLEHNLESAHRHRDQAKTLPGEAPGGAQQGGD